MNWTGSVNLEKLVEDGWISAVKNSNGQSFLDKVKRKSRAIVKELPDSDRHVIGSLIVVIKANSGAKQLSELLSTLSTAYNN